MSKLGRPPLGEEHKMVSQHVRVPVRLLEWYNGRGNRSAAIRRALEKYKEQNDGLLR